MLAPLCCGCSLSHFFFIFLINPFHIFLSCLSVNSRLIFNSVFHVVFNFATALVIVFSFPSHSSFANYFDYLLSFVLFSFYLEIVQPNVLCYFLWSLYVSIFLHFWFALQSWTNTFEKFTKFSKCVFLGNVSPLRFPTFLAQLSKFSSWVAGWVLALYSNHFSIFLIFPNYESLKSLSNSWGNWYSHFLVIIIQFCFTCDKENLC